MNIPFLHKNQVRNEPQLYLYSWGLAMYLIRQKKGAEKESGITIAKLDRYLQSNSDGNELESFEAFVGKSFSEFEQEWIRAMQKLKPVRSH